ncbi:MAG: hypothetical protein M3Z95_03795, partial [Actinomycetota bacterium]|nr:hypothetical protein [Actinomycetota bacterium]
MFVATALLYPCVLALLCVGAGLLVDRCSGGWLPGALLPALGAAALIAVSQLSTYITPLARATPYIVLAVALAGFPLASARARTLARRLRERPWRLALPVGAYALALAPVLLAGRPSFSSYETLSDSAVHMMGADYLIHHGQSYAHLDLRNSYGQYLNAYYNSSYPSGSDTLFGASALLLRLPLIWAFQPFNAFLLAIAAGPAWVLARALGLRGAWAALAALCATVPALVYGYELVGSIKEICALSLILCLGVLVLLHRRWLGGPARSAIPFALVVAGGVSALGAGFGAWALAAAVVLLLPLISELRAGRVGARRVLALLGTGVIVALVCAWPTWIDLSGSLQVAQNIVSTSNPGNLRTPLRSTQLFGVWLHESYKQPPVAIGLTLTNVVIAITLAAGILGAAHVLRRGLHALAGWLALTLAVWLAVSRFATTWVQGKTLVLTSPLVVLLAWAGVSALRAYGPVPTRRWSAALLALALAGGVLASDAIQYHASNLAPTARYQELAKVNARFAGKGPTLVSDFDEYALYVLRGLDIGGPNFEGPPPALAATGRYRYPVDFAGEPPGLLRAYPLIVTRRDPSSARPPSAYALIWQGAYYQVWGRRRGAPAAIADRALSGSSSQQCAVIHRLADLARSNHAQLVAASSPQLVRVSLVGSSHPAAWGHAREGRVIQGLTMRSPGRLSAFFALPRAGVWDMRLQA